jgi:hypothetical protein
MGGDFRKTKESIPRDEHPDVQTEGNNSICMSVHRSGEIAKLLRRVAWYSEC